MHRRRFNCLIEIWGPSGQAVFVTAWSLPGGEAVPDGYGDHHSWHAHAWLRWQCAGMETSPGTGGNTRVENVRLIQWVDFYEIGKLL